MSKLQKNNLVAQSNDLVNARFRITQNEFSLLAAMISLLEPNHKEFPIFTLRIKEVAEMLGINERNVFKELDKVTDRLMKRISRVITPEGDYVKFTWLNSMRISEDKSCVSFQFDNFLKPYLLELKKRGNFTQYKLGQIIEFKSYYTARVYGVLAEKHSKKTYVFEYLLDDFRQMMLGHESTMYPLYKNFRNKVIDTAKKELGEKAPNTGLYKSDLGFTLETRRTGRKISHLVFTIKKQPTQPLLKPSESGKNKATTDTAPQIILDYEFYGLDRLIVQPFLKQRGEQALTNTLEKFKNDKKRGAIQKNEQGYLRKLLKTNAGQATDSEKADTKKEKQQTIAKQAQQKAQQREALISEYKQAFGDNKRKRFIESLSSEQLEQVKNSLLKAHKGNSFVIERIKKNDLLSPFVMASLNDLIPDFYQQEENYINEKLTKAN